MGILAMLQDKVYGTVNIIHYASSKSKLVSTSVLEAELFAFIDGYAIGYTITHTLQEMFGRKNYITLYTGSRSLYGLYISLVHMIERRLQFGLAVIREAHEKREISNIVWIEGKANPTDGLTKIDLSTDAVVNVIAANHFLSAAESFLERDGKEVDTSSGGR